MAQETTENETQENTEAPEGTEEEVAVVEDENGGDIEEMEDIVVPDGVKNDPLGSALGEQIREGIHKIVEGNKILLADEDTSGVREIDKAFKADAEKEEKELSENLQNLWRAAEEAREAYKKNLLNARNAYREEVLHVEAEEDVEAEVDKDELQQIRTVVMNAISFLQAYAASNNSKKEIGEWVDTLQIPQVGRKGLSSVGVKKPRVNVFLKNEEGDPKIYNSFSEAAADLSTKDNKYTASEIAQAWNDSASAEADKDFEFAGKTLFVRFKEKTSK